MKGSTKTIALTFRIGFSRWTPFKHMRSSHLSSRSFRCLINVGTRTQYAMGGTPEKKKVRREEEEEEEEEEEQEMEVRKGWRGFCDRSMSIANMKKVKLGTILSLTNDFNEEAAKGNVGRL